MLRTRPGMLRRHSRGSCRCGHACGGERVCICHMHVNDHKVCVPWQLWAWMWIWV